MRYYVYKTTCIPTGKYYYGVHSERRKSDGYIGCGICSDGTAISLKKKGVKSAFLDAVIKYGYKSFNKEIVKLFDSPESAYQAEKEIVNEDLLSDKRCLNIRLGGTGGVIPSTMTKTVLIDCFNNKKIEYKSRAECQHDIGISNASKSKRFCNSRYVKEEFSQPISIVDENGNRFYFLDLYCCKHILNLNVDKIRMMMRGERKSTSAIVNNKKTKYFIL